MQIKTIENILRNKLNDWLKTIDDEDLRTKLRGEILVSGGCIVSMLLKEKVNDFDIYIKNRGILKKLVEYYVKDYKTNIKIFDAKDREMLIQNVGIKNFSELDSDDKLFGEKVSIRTLKEDQIKLFMTSGRGGFKPNPKKEDLTKKYQPAFFSPNAISLTDDIQIVIRFHGNNEEIHKTFDFIHATNYFTFADGLVTNKDALESIITKQLFYQGSLYPLTSIIRMKKFIKRNWNISAGEILKIMFQISTLNLTNVDVLEEQLIGVDIAYFSALISVLRKKKFEKIDSKNLNILIDNVFNSSFEKEDTNVKEGEIK